MSETRRLTGSPRSSPAVGLSPLVAVGYYVRRTIGPVRAFPAGLKMIAGDANARRPQPLARVGWGCGGIGATPRSAVVPSARPIGRCICV